MCQSYSHLNVVFEPVYKVSLYSNLTLGGLKFINMQHSIKTTIIYIGLFIYLVYRCISIKLCQPQSVSQRQSISK